MQREEERGNSIWREFHSSVWCMHAAMQDASTQAQQSLQRKAWSGGGASCWDSSPLLDDLSLFFPFPQCHFQNSLQITRNYIYNFTGFPGIAGAVVPVIFRGTRTSFGLPLRGSPKIYYLFRAPDGLYFPGKGESQCKGKSRVESRVDQGFNQGFNQGFKVQCKGSFLLAS